MLSLESGLVGAHTTTTATTTTTISAVATLQGATARVRDVCV